MGILDRLRGMGVQRPVEAPVSDEQAIERYRYMLRTAPPETIEQAHAEAFARLTPEQRRMALSTLAEASPPHERAATQAVSADDPRAMGRLATRAEMREPGFMERTFGAGGAAGGGFGGSLLGSFAMGFVGSMVAQSFLSSMGGGLADAQHAPATEANGASDASDAPPGDEGGDFDGADMGEGDFDGGDMGGDF